MMQFLSNKTNRRTNFSQIYSGTKLYMFLAVSLAIISLRTGTGLNCSFILTLYAGCLQTCITCTSAECTVNNSWWWAEELPETRRVSYQNKFGKISASVGFIVKKFVTMHGHVNLKCCSLLFQ